MRFLIHSTADCGASVFCGLHDGLFCGMHDDPNCAVYGSVIMCTLHNDPEG